MNQNKRVKVLNPKNVMSFLWQEERRSSGVLLIAAVVSLFLANSLWSEVYFDIIDKQFTLGAITLDVQHWISEGLMAIFFFMVGLEVKRELIDGELRSWKKASFPVLAAIGGMVVPALLYTVFNPYPPQIDGWAIPMATDIAIAIGIVGLLGRSLPGSLRVFLLALAIIDDVGSILVIGLFYSQPDNLLALLLAVILTLSLIVFRRHRNWIPSFIIIGLSIWYCLLIAGVSGTMAGVIVATMIPLTHRRTNAKDLQASEKIEDTLLPITSFFIVPLFVFTNAGLDFSETSLLPGSGLMVFTGVVAGLLIGKPVGILTASWLAVKLGITHKPRGVSWTQITGIGFIAGIGFTISLLIVDLSFSGDQKFQNAATLGVFVASIVSGFIGLSVLKLSSKNQRR